MDQSSAPIELCTPADFDQLIATLDEIYTAAHGPHHFPDLLPALYRPTPQHMRCNMIVRRNGRIAAVLGLFPIVWRVGDQTLRIAGIGGIATHPDFAGQGLMSRMLQAAIARIDNEGFDLSYLGGQRQRYRHYGWERAGTLARMKIEPANVRHLESPDHPPRLSLHQLHDPILLQQAAILHQAQPLHCLRDQAPFADYLCKWKRQGWGACDESGRLRAYLICEPGASLVSELVASDPSDPLATACAWVSRFGPTDFLMPMFPTPTFREMDHAAEYTQIEAAGNWRISHWPKVIATLMRARHQMSPLPSGQVVLGLTGRREVKLRLWVDLNGVGCQETDSPADIVLDPCVATRLLFGPLPAWMTAAIPPAAAVLAQWCPLPLTLMHADAV